MNPKRIIGVLIIACCIEVFGINFSNILSLADNSVEKNREYILKDMQAINWKQEDGHLTSQYDSNLIVEGVDTFIKKIKLEISSNQKVPYIQVFYTNDKNENFNGELLVEYGQPVIKEVEISLDQHVKNLRIDLGDEEGMMLDDIKLVINPVNFNFSISRIIAMILIYVLSIGLFYLQKNPDYNINEGKGGGQ